MLLSYILQDLHVVGLNSASADRIQVASVIPTCHPPGEPWGLELVPFPGEPGDDDGIGRGLLVAMMSFMCSPGKDFVQTMDGGQLFERSHAAGCHWEGFAGPIDSTQ